MTATMWKQIYGMTLYIFIITTIMYFFVDDMWDLDYENSMERFNNDGVPTNKAVVYTMIFNTFIWLHIFNEFNCRKVGALQYNVFEGLIANWMFLVVVVAIGTFQILSIQWGGSAVGCAPLTVEQHAGCMLWGSTSFLISAILKWLPNKVTEKLPVLVNEDQAVQEDKVMSAFNKQANSKAFK